MSIIPQHILDHEDLHRLWTMQSIAHFNIIYFILSTVFHIALSKKLCLWRKSWLTCLSNISCILSFFRAIYFFSYANMKMFLNSHLNPDTPLVHFLSALTAGKNAIIIHSQDKHIFMCESGLGTSFYTSCYGLFI